MRKIGFAGLNAFSYGLAAAVLEGTALKFLASQKSFLGNSWDEAMRLAVVLFRDREYGV